MSERECEARRQRLRALREAGVDAFPPRVGPWVPVAEVHERFDDRSEEELVSAGETVAVCGRVMASYGFAMEYPAQRFLRDARFLLPGGGTPEILLSGIGKEVGL